MHLRRDPSSESRIAFGTYKAIRRNGAIFVAPQWHHPKEASVAIAISKGICRTSALRSCGPLGWLWNASPRSARLANRGQKRTPRRGRSRVDRGKSGVQVLSAQSTVPPPVGGFNLPAAFCWRSGANGHRCSEDSVPGSCLGRSRGRCGQRRCKSSRVLSSVGNLLDKLGGNA